MKLVSILSRNGTVFIGTCAKLVSGPYVVTQDVLVDMADHSGIAAAIHNALENYSTDAEPPPRHKGPSPRVKFLCEAAGVKSWSAFMKGAKAVSLKLTSDGYVLQLSKNDGARGGFTPISEGKTVLPLSSTDEELGAAVVAALNASQ